MNRKRRITFTGIVIMVCYPIAATVMWHKGHTWTAVTIMSIALFVAYLTMKDAEAHGN